MLSNRAHLDPTTILKPEQAAEFKDPKRKLLPESEQEKFPRPCLTASAEEEKKLRSVLLEAGLAIPIEERALP